MVQISAVLWYCCLIKGISFGFAVETLHKLKSVLNSLQRTYFQFSYLLLKSHAYDNTVNFENKNIQ